MSVLLSLASVVLRPMDSDSEGLTTHSPIFPEKAEIIYGSIASILIFAVLIKFAGPMVKKSMAARTERIQKELDGAAADKASAATEAASIRTAKGDIGAERTRLLADADAQAAALLEDGRARLAADLVDMKSRATADIAAARGRGSDELRAEIARLSGTAADRAVAESLDDSTHQGLIEAFIQKVGASV